MTGRIYTMISPMLLPIINQDIIDENGRPIKDWSSRVRVVEGTFDGGMGFQGQGRPFGHGIRVDPTTLPNRIRFAVKQRVRDLPDVLYQGPQYLSTAAFRDVVEALEPGVHQIHPLTMTWRDGNPAPDRWIVLPTQRLDTADRQRTTSSPPIRCVAGVGGTTQAAMTSRSPRRASSSIQPRWRAGTSGWTSSFLSRCTSFRTSFAEPVPASGD